jgi:hypothetical protein
MIVERTLRATSQRSLSPVREAIERRLPWRRSVSAEAPTRAIPSPWKRLPTPRRRRDRLGDNALAGSNAVLAESRAQHVPMQSESCAYLCRTHFGT